MNIITENGKNYLDTYIAKIDNTTIDCSPFFIDLEDAQSELVKQLNKEHKTHFTYLNEQNYGYPIQSILNRFSGSYFSASFLKSYEDNPAGCFYSMLCEDDADSATRTGSVVHKILEDYYLLPKEQRTREKLIEIQNANLVEGQDNDKICSYIEGYLNTKDYLTGETLDDSQLDCECEYRGKSKIYVKDYDLHLPTCAYVIDRIDFRDDDIYIVDYKTGNVTNKNLTFEGNLGQMILYKWLVEQKFDKEVKEVYICAPGNKKYMKVDCGKENQEQMIERVSNFFTQFKQDNARRVYTYTNKGYFTNTAMREFREIMNDNSIRFAKIPVKVYIGEEKR